MLLMLKHDLHKLRTPNYESHSQALKNELMIKADGLAARMSRNWMTFKLEEIKPYRSCLISNQNNDISRDKRRKLQQEFNLLFNEDDAYKLHKLILRSKSINLLAEALTCPYTSLKYHVLLATALFYNLKNDIQWPKDTFKGNRIKGLIKKEPLNLRALEKIVILHCIFLL